MHRQTQRRCLLQLLQSCCLVERQQWSLISEEESHLGNILVFTCWETRAPTPGTR